MPSPWAKALSSEPVVRVSTAELRRLHRITIREGGATWMPGVGPVRPSTGYGMGARAGTFRKVRATDERAFIRAVRYLRRTHGGLIGTWLHHGYIHIDPSLVVPGPLELALEEARSRGQIAIYSFADGTTHTVEVGH